MLTSCLALGWAVLQAVTPIEVTLVDPEATGYATFQSHNQKVVSTERGIFTAHIRTRNEAYTAQTWRLSRSVDGGKTIETVYEATHATNPPVIEATPDGDLYVIRADFSDGNAYLYRFLKDAGFDNPAVSVIPGAAAGKYAAALDVERGRLYFAAHNNTFHVLDLGGKVLQSTTLWAGGTHAVMQYPLVDLAPDGAVHLAWTTQKHGVYLYWDIHHMLSLDGGQTWRNLNGAPLAVPVVVDDSGPATRISLDDEFENHTWLSSFAVHSGKVHFMYLAQTTPPREHYVRYDLRSGAQDLRLQPRFGGESTQILALDGFFAKGEGHDLYAVGSSGGQLVCLRSKDAGATWADYAASENRYNVYSVGGCRSVTRDGYIIGTFTDQAGSNADTEPVSKVYFVRIKAGL